MKLILRYPFLIVLTLALATLTACAAQPETITVVETVEVEKEVTVVETVEVEVEKEVTVIETVEVEVEKEVVVTATPEAASAVAPADVEQTLVLASGRNLGPGNPHDYSSSFVLLDLLYEPLVRYGQDGTIEPALAESWEISEDGLTWTFTLRQDVTFHDGTPFNAETVKWNMDRWVGVDRHNWLPTTSRIDSVEATDEFTVVLTLNQPYYPAMQDFTLVRPVRFLSSESVDQSGEFAQAIGTGPWQVESIEDNQAVLVRNESYWGEKPAPEKLVIEVILDPQTRIAALLSGEVDIIGGEYLGGISLESLPVLERNEAINILNGDSLVSLYISTQYQKPPFDDLRVRQALNMAIDRVGINNALFGGKGEAAQNLMPSNIPYVAFTDTDLYQYDPEKAAGLLAEAGWTLNADGILEKDGELMQIDLVVDQSS
ncbi:MAG: ABC transporter substrate-binding protein, partial [Chloroflexota bacterium]